MTMPQPAVKATLSEKALSAFEAELDKALTFHDEQLNESQELDDISVAIRRRSETARTEILAALSRISDGVFGICEECGAEIGSDRLGMMPHTRYCRGCAARS